MRDFSLSIPLNPGKKQLILKTPYRMTVPELNELIM
jgi:hypothetical protein